MTLPDLGGRVSECSYEQHMNVHMCDVLMKVGQFFQVKTKKLVSFVKLKQQRTNLLDDGGLLSLSRNKSLLEMTD